MTEPEQLPEESLASNIIGIAEYKLEPPKKKEFLPWHRPRKQFVREKQWRHQIAEMIKDIGVEQQELRYLGLPGEDLLDLRYFHQHICEPQKLQLRFLGFNYSANPLAKRSSELYISLDEVNKLPFVDPSSDILGDDFCQISNRDSIAWNRSLAMGPFDVINIDLCDGFGKQPHNQFQATHYSTLSQLLALQSRRKHPWLLLITTRTGSESVDGEVMDKFVQLYQENLQTCSTFKEISATKFSIANEENLKEMLEQSKTVSDVFLVALCKWVAGMCVGQSPPSEVEVKSVLGYKVAVEVEHQDLVSLAIRITPTLTPATDKLGLANHNSTELDECGMAVQALKRVSKLVDIDLLLHTEEEIMEEMITVSTVLLEEARYDVSSYREWAINVNV